MFHLPSRLKLVTALGGICLFTTLSSFAVNFVSVDAKSRTPYGLGLPRTARTGTAIRQGAHLDLPLIALLSPADGAKTVAAHPTFYWYFSPYAGDSQKFKDFKVAFYLRDEEKSFENKIFEVKGKASSTGIYKFTLPESSPSLDLGKVRRWQVRFEANGNSVGFTDNLYSLVLRTEASPEMQKKLTQATTQLAKARIYNSFGYWYDALDAYNQWLEANPKDDLAIAERRDMLAEGFKDIPPKMDIAVPGSELINLEILLKQVEAAQIMQLQVEQLPVNLNGHDKIK